MRRRDALGRMAPPAPEDKAALYELMKAQLKQDKKLIAGLERKLERARWWAKAWKALAKSYWPTSGEPF